MKAHYLFKTAPDYTICHYYASSNGAPIAVTLDEWGGKTAAEFAAAATARGLKKTATERYTLCRGEFTEDRWE